MKDLGVGGYRSVTLAGWIGCRKNVFFSIGFMFSANGIWPGRCTISKLRSNLGFLGAFPGAVTGWTTMVVTAAVYRLEDPNGWISN